MTRRWSLRFMNSRFSSKSSPMLTSRLGRTRSTSAWGGLDFSLWQPYSSAFSRTVRSSLLPILHNWTFQVFVFLLLLHCMQDKCVQTVLDAFTDPQETCTDRWCHGGSCLLSLWSKPCGPHERSWLLPAPWSHLYSWSRTPRRCWPVRRKKETQERRFNLELLMTQTTAT